MRRLANIAAFLFAFALCGGLLDLALPMPAVPDVTTKLAWLERHRAEYDTLFLGSSRVRQQISPLLFDRRMREHGSPTCSYNMGLDSLVVPEIDYLLDRILALRLPKLRLIVIDLNTMWRRSRQQYGVFALRSIYWHDWRNTFISCEAILRPPSGQRRDWGEIPLALLAQLEMLSFHYSHLGRGDMTGWLASEEAPQADTSDAGLDGRGFWFTSEQLSVDAAAEYEASVKAMIAREPESIGHDPVLERELALLLCKIDRAGVRTVFIRMPFVADYRLPSLTPRADGWPLTLDFDDPREIPSLYEARNHRDIHHLNVSGAEDLTTRIADGIAERLGQK